MQKSDIFYCLPGNLCLNTDCSGTGVPFTIKRPTGRVNERPIIVMPRRTAPHGHGFEIRSQLKLTHTYGKKPGVGFLEPKFLCLVSFRSLQPTGIGFVTW